MKLEQERGIYRLRFDGGYVQLSRGWDKDGNGVWTYWATVLDNGATFKGDHCNAQTNEALEAMLNEA